MYQYGPPQGRAIGRWGMYKEIVSPPPPLFPSPPPPPLPSAKISSALPGTFAANASQRTI